ncbi:SDR family NAD(P)-dependent oxidoreductase [Kribbella sp. NBC_00482]|uniref:SDR family NAD(P)-dependent oxidoreductase n=1 Tax=Kribbella sp. NBC_00482 TaxID=2975968 RepID=UPI002E18F884
MEIAGKVAVVTGAAVGIGRAIAVRLGAAGASVVVADVDGPGGQRTCELIGPSARFADVDVRDDAAVAELMACQPQILVNNAGGGVVVNVGSSAGVGFGPHVSPEYSAAKAGLIRLTTTLTPLHASHGVRVNCVVPDWVATPRGLREREALPPADRGPELIPLSTVTDAVVRLVEDESLAGRVLLLERE